MTELQWKRANDPEAMLFWVAPSLSRRQWNLLGCAVVRQAWDLLADEELRQLVTRIEAHTGDEDSESFRCTPAQLAVWRESVSDSLVREQHAMCRANGLDPDSVADHPPDPEYRAVSTWFYQNATSIATDSISTCRFTARMVGDAVELLNRGLSGHSDLEQFRETVRMALGSQSSAKLSFLQALKLKSRGDRAGDSVVNRRKRKGPGSRSSILADIQRDQSASLQRGRILSDRIWRAEEQAMGRLLHDLCGNPFQPDRFQEHWRTETVMGLASAIAREGRYDRLPILADALLEAGCDDEEMLQHCLGAETDGKAAVHHAGCWAIDRIRGREDKIVVALPLKKRRASATCQTRDADRNAAVS